MMRRMGYTNVRSSSDSCYSMRGTFALHMSHINVECHMAIKGIWF